MSDDVTPGADLARAALEQAKADAAQRRGMAAASRRAEVRRAKPPAARRAKGDPVLFGAAMRQLIESRGWTHEAQVASVMGRWSDLVGEALAAKCQPEALRDGELVIAAESTAWATQIRLLAPKLLERLRHEVGPDAVSRIRVHGPTRAVRTGGWKVSGGRGPRDTYG